MSRIRRLVRFRSVRPGKECHRNEEAGSREPLRDLALQRRARAGDLVAALRWHGYIAPKNRLTLFFHCL